MNRFGWIILLVFLAIGVVLALMIRFDGGIDEPPEPASGPVAQVGDLTIPVAGASPGELVDTWGESRAGGARVHKAIDIMAARGTLVVAAAPGQVEKLFDSNDGGRTIYVRSPDRRTVLYYAHLDSYRDGLTEGQQVKTGDVIGTVGSTGNASPDAPHLHFEVKQMSSGEGWWQGREVNPYPLLAGKASAR